MRLPSFRYVAPKTVDEACRILSGEGPSAGIVAGGTDLLPNMKRRQQTPSVLIGLRGIAELRARALDESGGKLGALATLAQLARDPHVARLTPGLRRAAHSVATPHLRNMATLGGNLCLDTRCAYYDQSLEWRQSIDYCMKKDGKVCWVAPGSPTCWAVSSSDTAPLLLALGASVTLRSVRGEREVSLDGFFNDDGIKYLTKAPDEILTTVNVPAPRGWRSTYLKCRRRGAFDFPILGVGAAIRLDGDRVAEARVVMGAVGCRPHAADTKALVGERLTDDVIEAMADVAAKLAKPLDNTDLNLSWRKRIAHRYVVEALRELRGDPGRVPTGCVPPPVLLPLA